MQIDTLDKTFNKVEKIYSKAELFLSEKIKARNSKTLLWIIFVLFVFTIILLMNIFTPMTADDFGYLFIHAEEGRVTSIADIIHSQYNHYMLWGGRSVVHFIAQWLLLLPPIVIDILNSFVYLLYITLMYWIIKGSKQHSLSLFVLLNLAVWFIQPAFGDTILWITGAANYLWGTTLILLFILPFRMYEGLQKGFVIQFAYSVLFLTYGVVAGWTNENTAGAMLLIAALFLIYYKIQGWKIPMWAIFGLVGAISGYVIMILAPGNAIRAGEAGHLSLFLICYRLFTHTLTLFTQYGLVILVLCIIFVLLGNQDNPINKTEVRTLSLIFILGFLAAIYAMVFSPSFPDRAWFGALTYLIIGIGIVFYNLDFKLDYFRNIRSLLIGIGLISFMFSFYLAARDIHSFNAIYKERAAEVEKSKKEGKSFCEFDRYEASTKFVHTEEERSNFLMTGYYGIEIRFKGID